MSTQVSSAPNGEPLIKKRTGFFSRLRQSNIIKPKKHHNQPTEQQQQQQQQQQYSTEQPSSLSTDQDQDNLQNQISSVDKCLVWLLSSDQNLEDWVQVLEFCDRLKINESDCNECVQLLRKSIKRSNSGTYQARAIRLTVILALNTSHNFRVQVASRKFLDVLELVYIRSNKTSNMSQPQYVIVRNMILRALSVLGHEFQNERELRVFAESYNKIKSPDAPPNGYPLSDSDPLFTPIYVNRSSDIPSQYPIQVQSSQNLPAMRDLRAEAEIARNNARLLIEALAFTTPSEMESNEIIEEFHSKCLQSQNQLIDDIPWATNQAELSRSRVQIRPTPNRPTLLQDHYGTEEEDLLEILLSANSELVDAFKQYDELEKLARSEKEIKEVEELSRKEATRNQIENAEQLTSLEEVNRARASGSSPIPPPTGASNSSNNDRLSETYHGYQVEIEAEDEVVKPGSDVQTADSTKPTSQLKSGAGEVEGESRTVAPIVRSEKALGKMRRISGNFPAISQNSITHQSEQGLDGKESFGVNNDQRTNYKEDFDVRDLRYGS